MKCSISYDYEIALIMKEHWYFPVSFFYFGKIGFKKVFLVFIKIIKLWRISFLEKSLNISNVESAS